MARLVAVMPIAAGLALAAVVSALAAGFGGLAAARTEPDLGWYWRRPISPQGHPPAHYLEQAKSLRPRDCAVCHPRQFTDWQTAVHSHAFSPGIEWQLREMEPGEVASCQTCHAPLAEQHERDADGRRNTRFDPVLRNAGVTCAACHLRDNVRYGPPRLPGHDPGIAFTGRPHGEVIRTKFFESAEFCAACHQFPAGTEAPNGKPLENTVAEWQASPYAARGISCQACHMPDRRHLWRGIHDPAMVRQGLKLELTDREARLTSTGVGHMFPTYVTPRVVLEVEARDGTGQTVASRSAVIERSVDLAGTPTRELSDTRLAPGGTLKVDVPDDPRAKMLRARVVVIPDHFYEVVFAAASQAPHSVKVKALLAEALRRARSSPYVALSAEQSLDGTSTPTRRGRP